VLAALAGHCWGFIEAAHFARRYDRRVQRLYERKYARANGLKAIKAVANKLARARFHVMRDGWVTRLLRPVCRSTAPRRFLVRPGWRTSAF